MSQTIARCSPNWFIYLIDMGVGDRFTTDWSRCKIFLFNFFLNRFFISNIFFASNQNQMLKVNLKLPKIDLNLAHLSPSLLYFFLLNQKRSVICVPCQNQRSTAWQRNSSSNKTISENFSHSGPHNFSFSHKYKYLTIFFRDFVSK